DGARGGAPAVPADHHAFKSRRAFLDERHEDHGAPGLEQHTFVDDLVSRRFLPVGLANDDQIEAPPDTSDLIRAARYARIDRARLARHARTLGRLLEARYGRPCLVVGFASLSFNYLRRNPAHYGAGNDRIIGDRDGEEMGLEDFRHRDAIINGRVVRAQPQIEDNILD